MGMLPVSLLTEGNYIALASAPYQEGETNTHAVNTADQRLRAQALASTGVMGATAEMKRR